METTSPTPVPKFAAKVLEAVYTARGSTAVAVPVLYHQQDGGTLAVKVYDPRSRDSLDFQVTYRRPEHLRTLHLLTMLATAEIIDVKVVRPGRVPVRLFDLPAAPHPGPLIDHAQSPGVAYNYYAADVLTDDERAHAGRYRITDGRIEPMPLMDPDAGLYAAGFVVTGSADTAAAQVRKVLVGGRDEPIEAHRRAARRVAEIKARYGPSAARWVADAVADGLPVPVVIGHRQVGGSLRASYRGSLGLAEFRTHLPGAQVVVMPEKWTAANTDRGALARASTAETVIGISAKSTRGTTPAARAVAVLAAIDIAYECGSEPVVVGGDPGAALVPGTAYRVGAEPEAFSWSADQWRDAAESGRWLLRRTRTVAGASGRATSPGGTDYLWSARLGPQELALHAPGGEVLVCEAEEGRVLSALVPGNGPGPSALRRLEKHVGELPEMDPQWLEPRIDHLTAAMSEVLYAVPALELSEAPARVRDAVEAARRVAGDRSVAGMTVRPIPDNPALPLLASVPPERRAEVYPLLLDAVDALVP